jgi:rhodanese-related sulfurtransferase
MGVAMRADGMRGEGWNAPTDLDRRVIVVCNEGYAYSLAAATLQRLGLHSTTDLVGCYQAWRSLVESA